MTQVYSAAVMALVLSVLPWASLAANEVGWPTYGFAYENTRHAPFDQINTANVHLLEPVWEFKTSLHGKDESSPIVVGRTLYVTINHNNEVVALDAVTGSVQWTYTPTLGDIAPCCGMINRGVAVEGGKVFTATMDGRLIALDARTGHEVWKTRVGDSRQGFSETMAPLAWRGIVYIGSSGGEFGIRGSFSAYHESDGKLAWRWWTVSPGWEGAFRQSVYGHSLHRNIDREKADVVRYPDAWKHGGGAVWMTPALDPQRATIYLSTGNPSPNYNGSVRPGDNLYTDSVVALDAHSGRMKWYYQETPHDLWDYDLAGAPILIDAVDASGRRVPAVVQAGKIGWVHVLSRDTGKLIRRSKNFVGQGHLYDPPRKTDTLVEPGGFGGTTGPLSHDPAMHTVFITAFERPDFDTKGTVTPWQPGSVEWLGGTSRPVTTGVNLLCAVNTDNGQIAWSRSMSVGSNRGTPMGSLSTPGLVFVPDEWGTFFAVDAKNGQPLWRYHVGPALEEAESLSERIRHWLGRIKRWVLSRPEPEPLSTAQLNAPPIAYMIDGREYIALSADYAPDLAIGGNAVIVFALPRQ
jgi:glucose dehydrogenase